MKTIIKLSIIFIISISSIQVAAQDFVYKPRNPSFGGDTFNYNWLLSSANAQNQTVDPAAAEAEANRLSARETDPLASFTESLNRQILSQLSRSLVSSQFGTGGELEEGSYVVGNFDITVEDIGEGLSVTIFDSSTGSETQIIIPFE